DGTRRNSRVALARLRGPVTATCTHDRDDLSNPQCMEIRRPRPIAKIEIGKITCGANDRAFSFAHLPGWKTTMRHPRARQSEPSPGRRIASAQALACCHIPSYGVHRRIS